jgi:hypothetical protein
MLAGVKNWTVFSKISRSLVKSPDGNHPPKLQKVSLEVFGLGLVIVGLYLIE